VAGDVAVHGVDDEIVIRRDGFGVPHIDAGSDHDAWFGLGFAIGQDRTFQLDFYRRAVSGTMAAAMGPVALPHDRLVRRIGYRRAAERQLDSLGADTVDLVRAYADGVNCGQEVGRRRRPLEHALLRLHPHPWEPVDVLAFIKFITASLSTNWDTELARLVVLECDGAAALSAIDAPYPEGDPVTAPVGLPAGAVHDLRVGIEQHQRWLPGAGGSNNWAVDGSRTADGSVLVANDPHLNPQVPSQWYLAHITTPEWRAAGATLVGAPGFIVGHNGHLAWGVTAGRADLSDLVVEEVSADRGSVARPDGWAPLRTVTEVIDVRGRRPVVEQVLVTDTGPVLSPLAAAGDRAISLRATWLEEGPLRGFFDANRQTDVKGLFDTFREWNGPNVNVVAGDAAGGIGWQYVAAAPDRRVPGSRVPVDGADPTTAWPVERIAFDDLPAAIGSDAGFLATANNQPVPTPDGPSLGDEWSDGYRVRRIHAQLARRRDWTADAVAALQLDQLVGAWREIEGPLLNRSFEHPDARLAAGLLDGWNGVASASSVAAAVFELTSFHLTRHLMTELAPSSTDVALGAPVHSLAPFNGMAVRRSSWLSDQFRAGAAIDPVPHIERALVDAVHDLRRRGGDRPENWAWGRLRPMRLHHLLSDAPLVGPLLGLGPIETGGSLNTVSMCASSPVDPLAPPVAMAGLRMVVSVGDWDGARFVLAGGQSGDPASRHYDDQLAAWATGGSISIPFTDRAVDEAVVDELRLRPASPEGVGVGLGNARPERTAPR